MYNPYQIKPASPSHYLWKRIAHNVTRVYQIISVLDKLNASSIWLFLTTRLCCLVLSNQARLSSRSKLSRLDVMIRLYGMQSATMLSLWATDNGVYNLSRISNNSSNVAVDILLGWREPFMLSLPQTNVKFEDCKHNADFPTPWAVFKCPYDCKVLSDVRERKLWFLRNAGLTGSTCRRLENSSTTDRMSPLLLRRLLLLLLLWSLELRWMSGSEWRFSSLGGRCRNFNGISSKGLFGSSGGTNGLF